MRRPEIDLHGSIQATGSVSWQSDSSTESLIHLNDITFGTKREVYHLKIKLKEMGLGLFLVGDVYSVLTFSRKNSLLQRGPLTPCWEPDASPHKVGSFGAGAGLEGEHTWQEGFSCQQFLNCRMSDPSHVYNRRDYT